LAGGNSLSTKKMNTSPSIFEKEKEKGGEKRGTIGECELVQHERGKAGLSR